MTAFAIRLDDPTAPDPADVERGAKVRPLPPLPPDARRWLKEHAAVLADYDADAADAKPLTTRPHESGEHSMIPRSLVATDVQVRLADRDDPLAWLVAREDWAQRVARAMSQYDLSLLADAERALAETKRRVPGWTGREAAQRTKERHAHDQHAARDAGQGEFGGRGFEL